MSHVQISDLQTDLNDAYTGIALFSIVAVITACIVAFCIFGIVKVVRFYKSQAKYYNDRRAASDPTKDTNNNDDVAAKDEQSQHYNDDKVFSKNINDSIAEYQSYNERLKAYYKDNKPEETPKDLIDKTILDPTADNY